MSNYFYISNTFSAVKNLALDEWFVDNISPCDTVLYLYINSNAVIIGKNQNPWKECDLSALERDRVELVRRITGGGAVYHDSGNLNFSFITGEKNYSKEENFSLMIKALCEVGINAEVSGRNDMDVNGRKFSGNAFCKRKDICQHHGTLLVNSDMTKLSKYLTVDERKIKSKGISSVSARVINLAEINENISVDLLKEKIIENYKNKYPDSEEFILTEKKLSQIKEYEKKHDSWEWRIGETPKFDIEFDERFLWGGVQILLSLEKGIISEVMVYSDANDSELPQKIRELLLGKKFDKEEITASLTLSGDEKFNELSERIKNNI